MLKLALAPQTPPGADMPRAIFYDDFGQLDRREWLCIQRAAILNDRRAAPLPGHHPHPRT